MFLQIYGLFVNYFLSKGLFYVEMELSLIHI